MNRRRVFRKYAQHKGAEAAAFVKIDYGIYQDSWNYLITVNSKGEEEKTIINFCDMVGWIFRNYNLIENKKHEKNNNIE